MRFHAIFRRVITRTRCSVCAPPWAKPVLRAFAPPAAMPTKIGSGPDPVLHQRPPLRPRRGAGLFQRPFATTAAMDAAMVARWNEVVGPDDAGGIWDFAVRQPEARIRELLDALTGAKHLIVGNNDGAATVGLRRGQRAALRRPRGGRHVADLCHYPLRTWHRIGAAPSTCTATATAALRRYLDRPTSASTAGTSARSRSRVSGAGSTAARAPSRDTTS